jgi:hypothetical protein
MGVLKDMQIFKDVRSSNGIFERLSAEGFETRSEPCSYVPLLSAPHSLSLTLLKEFVINKTIIHYKLAGRVVCVFSD